MKIRKQTYITIIILSTLIITSLLIVKSWTITKYGTINTKAAVVAKTKQYFGKDITKYKSIKDLRKYLNDGFKNLSSESIPFSNIKNINISGGNGEIPVRIYTPKENNKLPIIIYCHGGSWIGGNLDTHDNICRKLSKKTDAIVISVHYRLAPENPFPKGLNDVYDTLKWVYKNAEDINGNSKLVAIAGDSAGANLAAATCQLARDKNEFNIISQVLIYPSTNLYTFNTDSWVAFGHDYIMPKKEMKYYRSMYIREKKDLVNPYASPLLGKNFKKLPAALIITAQFDPLRDEGEMYGNKLKEANVPVRITRYKGIIHGFLNMDRILDQSDKAINEASLFLKNEFKK